MRMGKARAPGALLVVQMELQLMTQPAELGVEHPQPQVLVAEQAQRQVAQPPTSKFAPASRHTPVFHSTKLSTIPALDLMMNWHGILETGILFLNQFGKCSSSLITIAHNTFQRMGAT